MLRSVYGGEETKRGGRDGVRSSVEYVKNQRWLGVDMRQQDALAEEARRREEKNVKGRSSIKQLIKVATASEKKRLS